MVSNLGSDYGSAEHCHCAGRIWLGHSWRFYDGHPGHMERRARTYRDVYLVRMPHGRWGNRTCSANRLRFSGLDDKFDDLDSTSCRQICDSSGDGNEQCGNGTTVGCDADCHRCCNADGHPNADRDPNRNAHAQCYSDTERDTHTDAVDAAGHRGPEFVRFAGRRYCRQREYGIVDGRIRLPKLRNDLQRLLRAQYSACLESGEHHHVGGWKIRSANEIERDDVPGIEWARGGRYCRSHDVQRYGSLAFECGTDDLRVVLVHDAGGSINFNAASTVHDHQRRDGLELHARSW